MIIGTRIYDPVYGYGRALCPILEKDCWNRRRYLAWFHEAKLQPTSITGFHSIRSHEQQLAIADERVVGPCEALFALWVAGELRYGMCDFKLTLTKGWENASSMDLEDIFAELNRANVGPKTPVRMEDL